MLRPPPSSTLFPYTTLFRSDRELAVAAEEEREEAKHVEQEGDHRAGILSGPAPTDQRLAPRASDRKSTRLNSSHPSISYAVFCLKKRKKKIDHVVDIYANVI